MEITQELVERIAHLARLTMTQDEKDRMRTQLEDVLGSMTALDKLTLEEDADTVEHSNVLRPDEAEQSMERASLLANAPAGDGEYILVPGALSGAQLIGSAFGESKVLNEAHAFQRETCFYKNTRSGSEKGVACDDVGDGCRA